MLRYRNIVAPKQHKASLHNRAKRNFLGKKIKNLALKISKKTKKFFDSLFREALAKQALDFYVYALLVRSTQTTKLPV
jgi:hypothetical protein